MSGEDPRCERDMPRLPDANRPPLADQSGATRCSALMREVRKSSYLNLGKRCPR